MTRSWVIGQPVTKLTWLTSYFLAIASNWFEIADKINDCVLFFCQGSAANNESWRPPECRRTCYLLGSVWSQAPPSASLLSLCINPISAILITTLIRGEEGKWLWPLSFISLFTQPEQTIEWEREHMLRSISIEIVTNLRWLFVTIRNRNMRRVIEKKWEANDRSQMLPSINQVDKQIVTHPTMPWLAFSFVTSSSTIVIL